MGTVVPFPTRSRVAANDAGINPWLSTEPLPEVEPVKTEPDERPEPVYAIPYLKTDPITGDKYTIYVMPGTEHEHEERKPGLIWVVIGCLLGFSFP